MLVCLCAGLLVCQPLGVPVSWCVGLLVCQPVGVLSSSCASLRVCLPPSVLACWCACLLPLRSLCEESTFAFPTLSLQAQLQVSCSPRSHNQAAVALRSHQLQPILVLHCGLQGQGLDAYSAKSPSLSWFSSGDLPHP